MKHHIRKRVLKSARLILRQELTIRQVADKMNVSKSTTHFDLSKRLKNIDEDLYNRIRDLMRENLEKRHAKRGEATKRMWKKKMIKKQDVQDKK